MKRFMITKNSVMEIQNLIKNHETRTIKSNLDYDYIKNKYGNKSRLLFTDTESLTYEIKTENAYDDFSENKETFDFTNYFATSKYYEDLKTLVVVKMKDDKITDEAVLLLKNLLD